MPRPQPSLDSEPGSITRRAPFANNPVVGARGQQAQLRILEAALQVFAEMGYHRCGVKRITELAGCSRASFYQYFSSKEDLFRHLAGHVARQLRASTDAVTAITPDAAGLEQLRTWLDDYSEVYDAFEPVFVTFHVAAAADEEVAAGSARVGDRQESALCSKVVDSPLPDVEVTRVIRTLLDTVARSNRVCALIEMAHPHTPLQRPRLNAAIADVFHRALFGIDPAVNSRQSPRPASAKEADEADRIPQADPDEEHDLGPVGLQTRAAVLEAGHQVFVERGYYGTRVDDVAKAAGVSHGVFYRYFKNKNHLFRILAARAGERLGAAFKDAEQLDPTSPTAQEELRAWLHRYAITHSEEAAIIRVWTDALARDPKLGTVSVDGISSGRSSLLRLLRPRGFGDIEAEAVVLLVLLEAMVGGSPNSDREDRVASVIERSVVCLPALANGTGNGRAGGRRRLRLGAR
jgi:AcrR family transcriptional regulator